MSRLFALFQQFGDDNLQPLASGTLKFTLNGVTSTLQNTFSDVLLTDANPNPITLDGEGRLPFDVWGSGVYSVILKDKNGVLIKQLNDASGGADSGSGFGVWSDAVAYNIPAFVVGSNGLYYRTLSDGNLNNDPILNPGTNLFWEEFKLRGVWNSGITYVIGNIVQTTAGNLWQALTATAANNPETDGGTNWIPAFDGSKVPEIIVLEGKVVTLEELLVLNSWETPETADFTGANNESRQIDASANTVDVTLPVLVAGDSFIYHNLITSTFKVQILNPIETIKGTEGDIAAATNLELEAGQSVQMVAKSATILSVVGALL